MWKALTFLLAGVIVAGVAALWLGYDLRNWPAAGPGVTTPPPGVTTPPPGVTTPPPDGIASSEPSAPAAPGEAVEAPERPEEHAVPTAPPAATGAPEPEVEEDPAADWSELADRVRQSLDAEDLPEAEQAMAALDRFDLDRTAEQAAETAGLRRHVEQLGLAAELRAAVARLAGGDPDEIRAAENLLFERADEAIPLLAKAVEAEDPALVCGAMACLAQMERPNVTLPMIVGVLGRPEQAACWPEAVRRIEQSGAAGAGEPLLELALTAESPQQRTAALDALARCADPPPRTIVALLPLLYADGPELAAALRAARHAAVRYGPSTLWAGHGASQFEPAESERLLGLGGRLRSIVQAESAVSQQARQAAGELAIALRQVVPAPLEGVQVVAFGAERPDGRAANVLHGTWDTTDPKHMWRYPAKEPHSIVLDLGSDRTVVGVRLWNFNHPQHHAGGWRDVAVSVGSSSAELAHPVAAGTVPAAPGEAGAADFGTTIPVRFHTGRYVRLHCTALHGTRDETGLTAVEVLGF